MQQLAWDPEVDASGIGVTARTGAVTLTGSINTYAGKLAAERAAKRVCGVRAVANDLDVTLAAGRTDADIAADAVAMLRVHHEVPASVQAVVHHGQITLTGTVHWHYQRVQAAKAVRYIKGVRHVIDHLAVVPRAVRHDM
jgi:VCBS repeat-containing protein